MNVELITIGDEILIGQIVDTNSAWMATELNAIGVKVIQITSIQDTSEHLIETLNSARKRADIIIMTGGLGPTKDDLTKNTLCDYFNSKLILHEPTLEHISELFFKIRGIPVNKINKDQALVPECCQVLFNRQGTAPGMWFEDEGTIFISMAGVPYEMKGIMQELVLPKLQALNGTQRIVHKTVLVTGLSESGLSETLNDWELKLPSHIKLAYLPNPGNVRLRFSAFGNDEAKLTLEVEDQIKQLKAIIPNDIYGYEEQTLASVVGEMLVAKNATLASAESCTGGNIAHLITSIPGSSEWYKGSVVAYSNETKQNLLRVNPNDIAQFGAVSEQVVKQMAEGARKALNTDYAIATSGIAGPGGGTEEKPVGTVWIAIATPKKTIAKLFKFSTHRERNIIRSSQSALNMLRLNL